MAPLAGLWFWLDSKGDPLLISQSGLPLAGGSGEVCGPDREHGYRQGGGMLRGEWHGVGLLRLITGFARPFGLRRLCGCHLAGHHL